MSDSEVIAMLQIRIKAVLEDSFAEFDQTEKRVANDKSLFRRIFGLKFAVDYCSGGTKESLEPFYQDWLKEHGKNQQNIFNNAWAETLIKKADKHGRLIMDLYDYSREEKDGRKLEGEIELFAKLFLQAFRSRIAILYA